MIQSEITHRMIESGKDPRGRITHWHCSMCEWTTLGSAGASPAMALKFISDTFDTHKCANYKKEKRLRKS
jgi:hypothetical protein